MTACTWIILHKEKLMYYRGSGGVLWCNTLQQAKKYRRRGDVGNAIALAKEFGYFNRADVKVLRYKLILDEDEG